MQEGEAVCNITVTLRVFCYKGMKKEGLCPLEAFLSLGNAQGASDRRGNVRLCRTGSQGGYSLLKRLPRFGAEKHGFAVRDAPPILFSSCGKENAPCTVEEKRRCIQTCGGAQVWGIRFSTVLLKNLFSPAWHGRSAQSVWPGTPC